MVRQAQLYALHCMNDHDFNTLPTSPQLACPQVTLGIATMLCILDALFIIWYVFVTGLTVVD